MVTLRLQDGKIIIKDGKVGTEQACCCGSGVCCTSCIEYFFDIELYNAGCPEGWNQDTYGTCIRLRANINGSECGAAANYPIECGGECFDPDFPDFTFPCCGKVCQEPVDGPCCDCPPCSQNVELDINGGISQICNNGIYSGDAPILDPDNTHGGTSVILYCEPDQENPNSIIWKVESVAGFSNFTTSLFCTKTYEGIIQNGPSCLPSPGVVTMTLIDTVGDGGCDKVTEPEVNIIRNDLP